MQLIIFGRFQIVRSCEVYRGSQQVQADQLRGHVSQAHMERLHRWYCFNFKFISRKFTNQPDAILIHLES